MSCTSFETTIELRPSVDEDREFLYEVFCSTRPDVMQAPLSPEQMEQFLRMQFRAQDTHYHTHYPDAKYDIIFFNDQRIGRLYLAKMESEFRILDIALLPEFRSKGIGAYLVRQVLEECQAADRPLRIHVLRDSREYHFYERIGFRQIGDLQSHLFMECK
jgi:ribosomal protein S18 acetylase RimI-like enzyme